MSRFTFIRDLIAKKSIHSLSMKLIIAIGVLISIGSLSFWYSIINTGNEEIFKTTVANAGKYINLIKKSSYYSMLTNNTDTIQKTIEGVASEEGIRKIRIYDLKGRIIFSSDRSSLGKIIPPNSDTCMICHDAPDTAPTSVRYSSGFYNIPQWIVFRDGGERVLKTVVPVFNDRSCYTSSCHFHSETQKVLGVLEMDYSLKPLDTKLRQQNIATASFGVIFTAFTSVILCIILWKIVINPLLTLAEGMKSVSRGNLDHHIGVHTKDEIGMLAGTFNSMTREIKTSRERLENWAKELEEEVAKKTEEIRRGQEQFIHTEKLASLGRMAAGVAHELNSPLTGIVTFAHLMIKRIPSDNKMDREDLEVIIEQAERCSKIIKGLLGFSRAIPAEKNEVNVNDTLRHAIGILQNQAKFLNIKIEMNTAGDLPFIKGDSSQIEQVFLNLVINAADAMNDKGRIAIRTSMAAVDDKQYIEIEFADNGPGIPEEHLSRLFEPFFTTKPVGKGTGLGLAVSHGIIKKHGGHIVVRSNPGEGAAFFVRLPVLAETRAEGENGRGD